MYALGICRLSISQQYTLSTSARWHIGRYLIDMSINMLPTCQGSFASFFSWVDCLWSPSVNTWLACRMTLGQILDQFTSNGWQHIGQENLVYRLCKGFYLLFAKFKPNMKSFASHISIDIMNVFLVGKRSTNVITCNVKNNVVLR